MKDEILKILEDEKLIDRSIASLSKLLKQDSNEAYIEFVDLINQLENEGIIVCSKQNYYLPQQLNMLVGSININKKGFGFVTYSIDEEDIFIGKDNLKDAFNKDIVLIEVSNNQDGNHQEGKVIKIIKRGQTKFVGEVKMGKKDYYVAVDDSKFEKMIFVDSAHLHGAMIGHKVVVEIKTYKPIIKGNIISIIGHKLDPGVDILSIVNEHDVPIEFDKAVYEQISDINDTITKEDLEGRVDLRNEVIVTIDGDDAKDLDDAISLSKLDNGNYYLGVHIADVTNYVTEGSALDKEAISRGTSIYLVDRVIPMLPHKLSNGICSLNPKVDRLTISCFMEINQDGKVVNHKIVPAVIHSKERMTYTNVNHILDGNEEITKQYEHVKDLFFLMQEVALILKQKRSLRGAIDFDVKEAKVLVDSKGKPTDVVLRTRGDSDKIIEEFMLLANETVAEHFKWLDVPFIYRVHEHPKKKKLMQFTTMVKPLGYTIKGSLENVYPSELSNIIETSKGTPEHTIIATLLLRCMQKARYDSQCLGHFGLADKYYTHFTSPIRRYPDLLVHRLIRTYLFENKIDGKTITHFQKQIPLLAEQASNCEREAVNIEREVTDMKMAEYMEKHIGEEFDGIISSVTNFGFFVELDNTIDGLVHVSDLTDDYYFFDEKNVRYVGQRTGKTFKMSDQVKVKVIGASKKEKSVDFEILGMKSNKKTKKVVIIKEGKDSPKKSLHRKGKSSNYRNDNYGVKRKQGKRKNSK